MTGNQMSETNSGMLTHRLAAIFHKPVLLLNTTSNTKVGK